ncbi:MAG TPA: DPP IV N-terminal domain-containing protein [Phycisphaerales bacterium]|nr:DPP IV N-terminal domain-containing protein [Phycisphaerales bacterium]
MNRQSAAVTASVAAAMLLAACGSQNPVSTGRWPSNPESVPQQAFVTTPGAAAPGVVRVPTKQQAAAGTVTQNTTVTHATSTGAATTATPAQAASSPTGASAPNAGTAPAAAATSAAPAATNAGFEITSDARALPVHQHAPQLGSVPNETKPTEDVDTSAVFRPTTAKAESMEPSTQNVSRVTYAEEGADFDPSLSRDGDWMVFASTAHRATSDIYLKRVSSRVVTQLTNDPAQDMCPRISPDGKQIAFCSDRSGNWDVYVMPIEGGRPVQVTFDQADEIAPSWSPDGTQVVYSRMGENSGRWEMWIAQTNRPEIANFIGYGLFPQWAPVSGTGKDGADQVLFQVGRERGRRTFGIWTIDVMDGQAGNASEVRSSSRNALINPSWSPDGRWVVFAEVPVAVGEAKNAPLTEASPSEPYQMTSTLWLVSVDNEAPVRLTFGNRLALSPVWSRSNRLFFVSNNTGVENIWSLDMTKPLTTAAAMIRSDASPTYATQPEDGGEVLNTGSASDR